MIGEFYTFIKEETNTLSEQRRQGKQPDPWRYERFMKLVNAFEKLSHRTRNRLVRDRRKMMKHELSA